MPPRFFTNFGGQHSRTDGESIMPERVRVGSTNHPITITGAAPTALAVMGWFAPAPAPLQRVGAACCGQAQGSQCCLVSGWCTCQWQFVLQCKVALPVARTMQEQNFIHLRILCKEKRRYIASGRIPFQLSVFAGDRYCAIAPGTLASTIR